MLYGYRCAIIPTSHNRTFFKEEISMKHKLSVLPVLFTLLALVFVLTACGSDGNVQSEGVIKPRTITF